MSLKRMTSLLIIPILLLLVPIAGECAAPAQFTKTESTALLAYARDCLLARLEGASTPAPPGFATKRQRACFVTFFRAKRVFACFGGFSPRRANLAEEISENVRLALKNDARSRAVSYETALSAGVQITFPIGQPERVDDYRSIDPLREGMFVESGDNGVAFVPGEARTASWAFREALRRLGVKDPAAVQVGRFRAEEISTRNTGRGL
jgi:AMMECR1 domain-containing protein